MTARALSRRHLFGAASGLLTLGGCSLLFPPPPPQLYRLVPQINRAPDGAPAKGQLVVSVPMAPQSLDTDRIALTRDPSMLDYFAAAAWTDRAPLLLQALMINAFQDGGQDIAVGRDASNISADYRLDTELRDFQARYTATGESPPVIVMSLDAQLVRLADHRVVRHVQVTKEAPATQNNLPSIVEAFDMAAGEVIGQIVSWTLGSMTHVR